MSQSTHAWSQTHHGGRRKLVNWRNTGVVALFLFGTTFLWLTSAFAGKTHPPTGVAWTITNVLAIVTVLGFSVASWGILKVSAWWEALAAGSAVFGVAVLIPYWFAAHSISGVGSTAYAIAIHVIGSAVVPVLLTVPTFEHWIQHQL